MSGEDQANPAGSGGSAEALPDVVVGRNSIENATVNQAVQAGVINGGVHIHLPPPVTDHQAPPVPDAPLYPVAKPAADASSADVRQEVPKQRELPGWVRRVVRYLVHIVEKRSPLLLVGLLVFSANSMLAGFLGFLFGTPPPGAAPAVDLGLVATMSFLAVPSAFLLLRRRKARRNRSPAWPSMQEVHPILTRRFARLNRPVPLVLMMSVCVLLMLVGAFAQGGRQPSSSPYSEFSSQAMVFLMLASGAVACGILLVRRSRNAESAMRSTSEPSRNVGARTPGRAWLLALSAMAALLLWLIAAVSLGFSAGAVIGALFVPDGAKDLFMLVITVPAGFLCGVLWWYVGPRWPEWAPRRSVRAGGIAVFGVALFLFVVTALAAVAQGPEPVSIAGPSALGNYTGMLVFLAEGTFTCGYVIYRLVRPREEGTATSA